MFNSLLNIFKTQDAHLTVSTSFDDKYLHYGKILLNSLLKNSPQVQVKVLAINIEEENLQEYQEFKNIEIIHENKEFTHAYEQRLYSIARRIFFINELRSNPNIENLLQLDADTIIRKDLNKFGKLFEQGDLCIFARPKMKHEALRLTMNIIGLSNTMAAKALTQEWVLQLWNLLEQPQDSKYIDQLTLWKAYEKINHQSTIKLINLTHPYIGRTGNTIIRAFAATKDAKGDTQLLKELNQYSSNLLQDAPSNAPKPPEEQNIFLHKEFLIEQFSQSGLIFQ
ncbi:hypothetical protein Sta7437_3645 [Stanieria cyanosphaera PCC 7437]|uniref:Nucleotide-diphospho-sugar transferase domain-containing protein n=1 Tax=Stanieria cyanosphaera (strain ATCC 29371 / PCC 7437) TaxID=111780 RepID=K9XX97_STAC7|nr:hypothetical protein [Stanieria cyanosphaera]AFZ37143.1 hypothetical protein Sta7437_3645 [Stanieria cyanosphaera PCC 7437]